MTPPFWFDSGLSPATMLYTLALTVAAAFIIGGFPALKGIGRPCGIAWRSPDRAGRVCASEDMRSELGIAVVDRAWAHAIAVAELLPLDDAWQSRKIGIRAALGAHP